jgi:hypothetical protein
MVIAVLLQFGCGTVPEPPAPATPESPPRAGDRPESARPAPKATPSPRHVEPADVHDPKHAQQVIAAIEAELESLAGRHDAAAIQRRAELKEQRVRMAGRLAELQHQRFAPDGRPPVPTNGPSAPNGTSRAKIEEIRRFMDLRPTAFRAHGPPPEMRVGSGERATIRLWLGLGMKASDLTATLREQGKLSDSEGAQVKEGSIEPMAHDFEAKLGYEPKDVDVTPFGNQRRSVLDRRIEEWQWEVSVKQPQERVRVTIQASVYAPGSQPVEHTLGEFRVKAVDTPGAFYDRHKDEIQWGIGGGGGGALLVALARWAWRRMRETASA